MLEGKLKRIGSIFLVLIMVLSLWNVPVYGAGSGETVSVSENVVTSETSSITVQLTQVPDSGILRVIQMEAGESYDSSKLNSYTSLNFTLAGNLEVGTNVLPLSPSPEAGKKIMVILRDSGGEIKDYTSDPVIVAAAETENPKPESILANCSAELVKDGKFQQDDTGVDVRVKLDSHVESCYLTIYAYAGNTSFDPDDSHNKRLWSGRVTDGYEGSCSFAAPALPLQAGYKVIASLNVPLGDDYYRAVNSQAVEVVDENGEGFQDYIYPDVKIDETELTAGTTSLHISLTGDERLFQAAREGKTSIVCAVGQYPDGESFDFEGENQISLASNIVSPEAFSNREITLSEPLREGYRVRAVVYWAQNTDIFLAKGNDYEPQFGYPDGSVLVADAAQDKHPGVTVENPVLADADKIRVNVRGDIPEGSVLLIKSYESGTTEFQMSQGAWVGSAFDVTAQSCEIIPQSGSLAAGKLLVAFLQREGSILAQSAPTEIQKAQPFTIQLNGVLTPDSRQAEFQVAGNSETAGTINIAALCRVASDGTSDTENPIARKYGQAPGTLLFEFAPGTLADGEKVCLVLTYANGSETYQSDSFAVRLPLTENSLKILEESFTTASGEATVVVAGCEEFQGGRLILTTGPAGELDADSRKQIGSVTFTGEGSYTISLTQGGLKAGETILPHLYLYDAETDAVKYKYGDPVLITSEGGDAVKASVEIVTSQVRADREDIWVTANFDSTSTGRLDLYCYAGESYTEEDLIYSGDVTPGPGSQKIIFGSGKLEAGEKLTAVLALSDGSETASGTVTVQAVPEKQKPAAHILDSQITEGDTYMKVSLTFDPGAEQASYKLYQFTGETLDQNTDMVINEGSLYRSETNKSLYLGTGKLKAGAKLQVVLTVDGAEALSETVTVEPSPDWGTPYAAFDVSAVKADADSIAVTVDYADDYLAMGEEFYCDVTIYQFSAAYTDEEFEEGEMWEQYGRVTRVGQVNSTSGQETRGKITVPVKDGVVLTPGDRVIIKLRLPHAEWEGEEVDYLSASVPVISPDEEVPDYKVVLYNLGEESSRGARLRTILNNLGIPAETMEYGHLNESVGYLAGLEGYESAVEPYTGVNYTTEFMLMCNLPESLLDRFLDAMTDGGLRIDHKAIVTEYNREYLFYELIGDIEEEHDVFQALLALGNMVKEAEKLLEDTYGETEGWADFQTALSEAREILSSNEPPLASLQSAYSALKEQYLELTGMTEIEGTAVITVEKENSGAYSMTVRVKDGPEDAEYEYSWSSGEKSQTLTGVPAESLISNTVTVTGVNMFGKLTAQLQVPERPNVSVMVGNQGIQLNWAAASAADNCPAPENYSIVVYAGEQLVKTYERGGQDTSAYLEGLEEETTYTVKMYAVSPVGRSDMAILAVTTGKAEQGGPGQAESGGQAQIPSVSPSVMPAAALTSGKKTSSSVNTSDRTSLLVWSALVLMCGAGAVVMGVRKKKMK